MPDVPRDQLAFEIEALETEPMHGSAPADPEEFERAKFEWYAQLALNTTAPYGCLPDHGVHIYVGSRTCLCKTKPPTQEGVQ